MASRVDLHTHTTASDGTLAASGALFDHAAELQIQWLAVSDHDTTAGFQAIVAEHSRHPEIHLIPAIEMGAEGAYSCHLLGYFIDVTSIPFQNQLAQYRARRLERIQAMIEKLHALNLNIEYKRVLEIAGRSLARPSAYRRCLARERLCEEPAGSLRPLFEERRPGLCVDRYTDRRGINSPAALGRGNSSACPSFL